MIAAFVHGGVIAHLLHLATGSERFAFTGAENGSLSQLLLTAEGIKVRSFNDVSHLAHLEAGDGRMT
jgi:probable phosphoglycerate mutase